MRYKPVKQEKCIAPILKPPKQEVMHDRHKTRMKYDQ